MSQPENTSLAAQPTQAPNAKLFKRPPQQRNAELERLAEQINHAHLEIQEHGRKILKNANQAIMRARACGCWLLEVKKQVGHRHFERWCAKHLEFKTRTAEYYMRLAKGLSEADILRYKPQSLRQALICAGALPEVTSTKGRVVNCDPLTRVRKTVEKLLRELHANDENDPGQLLLELEPLVEFRTQLAARLSGNTEASVAVDVASEIDPASESPVLPASGAKTQHDAFLPDSLPQPANAESLGNSALEAQSIKKRGVSFRLSALKHSRLRDLSRANRARGARTPSLMARTVVLDYLEGRLRYTKPDHEDVCAEFCDGDLSTAISQARQSHTPAQKQERIVSFRLTAQMHSRLEDVFRMKPMVGVGSPFLLARKVILDFIAGRLLPVTTTARQSPPERESENPE